MHAGDGARPPHLQHDHPPVSLRTGALIVAFAAAFACGRYQPPAIALNPQLNSIDVTGLPPATLTQLSAGGWTDERWQAFLRVSVKGGADGSRPPAVAGTYAVVDRVLRFTPMFPFDAGREYEVVLDPDRLREPDTGVVSAANLVTAVVSLPAVARTAATVVTRVYPSGAVVPANQLRMYLHFSAPMDWRSGHDFLALLDERGTEVVDTFLPLDADFWNHDRTRYTVFFRTVRWGARSWRDIGIRSW
jgi:hypothetical protein